MLSSSIVALEIYSSYYKMLSIKGFYKNSPKMMINADGIAI